MTATLDQLKYALHLSIDAIDDEEMLLELLHALPGKADRVEEPEQYYAIKSQVAAAEKRIDAGEYTTQEDLEEEAKNWFQ